MKATDIHNDVLFVWLECSEYKCR